MCQVRTCVSSEDVCVKWGRVCQVRTCVSSEDVCVK